MKHALAIALCGALALAASMPAAAADTGSLTPPVATPTVPRLASPTGLAAVSETTISGLVTDANGSPMRDVVVKLYVGGLLTSEFTTSIDGAFEMVELIDYGRDVTVDLWFVPSKAGLLMENVILKESSAAIAHGLYSKCTKRVRLDPITDMIVKIVDAQTRASVIQRSGCAS
jgi:hypothetical protein